MMTGGFSGEDPSAPDPDDAPIYWEPWEPKIGDRVVVRLSGECQLKIHPSSPGAIHSGLVFMHPPELDGKSGVIVPPVPHFGRDGAERLEYAITNGHPYIVELDSPICLSGISYAGATFAAAELEPAE